MQVRERENKIEVSCEIVNTGKYDGAEIVQLYVKAPETNVFKPNKELRAFAKVYRKQGKTKKVEMVFNNSDLRYFDINAVTMGFGKRKLRTSNMFGLRNESN